MHGILGSSNPNAALLGALHADDEARKPSSAASAEAGMGYFWMFVLFSLFFETYIVLHYLPSFLQWVAFGHDQLFGLEGNSQGDVFFSSGHYAVIFVAILAVFGSSLFVPYLGYVFLTWTAFLIVASVSEGHTASWVAWFWVLSMLTVRTMAGVAIGRRLGCKTNRELLKFFGASLLVEGSAALAVVVGCFALYGVYYCLRLQALLDPRNLRTFAIMAAIVGASYVCHRTARSRFALKGR